jgi:hypothetical protein
VLQEITIVMLTGGKHLCFKQILHFVQDDKMRCCVKASDYPGQQPCYLSGKMNKEMTGFAAASYRFENIDFKGMTHGRFKNSLVRSTCAFAMQVVGLYRPVPGSRAITTGRCLTVPDMNAVTITPYLKILLIRFYQLVNITLPLLGYFLFETVSVKTGTSASFNQPDPGLFIQFPVH